jgi:hypothetical protein
MDPFTYFSGNPKLKPTLTQNVQASYSYKDVILSLKYSNDQNSIARFQSKVDPIDKKTYFYSENIDRVQTYTLSINVPLTIVPWWKTQSSLLGLYQQINTIYQDVPVNIIQMSNQVVVTNTLTLPKNYTLELSGNYFSPARFGIALLKSHGLVSFGVQKKMGSSSLSVNITDIFWNDIYRFETVNAALNQNQKAMIKLEPRVVRVSYSFNFGNKAVKTKQRSTASETEQGRVR